MIDLMGKKWWFFILSGIIILPGIISLGLYGLNLGVDFTGGALLEYKFENKLDKEDIRREFISSGIEVSGIVETGEASYIVKTKPINEQKIIEVKKSLSEKFGQVEELRVENVGPTIGVETTRNAFVSLGLASAMIVIYLALAFRKVPKPTSPWRFGVTAVIALLHDVLLLVGLFSLLGHFLKVEVDVLFVTAALTVVGFSVHDTIVVFDRIRENLPKHLSRNFSEVANISVTQTLARSLNTSLTVVFVLLALLLFGGETIRWFTVALLAGIISGTYSSIFNATALLVLWEEKLGH
ncbi:protein-export membrane protein SecF [Candidatus Daviesbacteria bacterium RIFCSPLOWO2_01_FULL_43_38]|uniref:Protein-export membrane protein SecF n=1 Tax=Candidatus Daviesbacteria bacterium RIFCSPHIGHO2_12_FULL_43_11 TaxID=1797780 RepID=A0A1F5K7F4_9BACT|nr:MAG: protein-export membrane protein SecF [Candidatus Daviesbacteria bacterium RIFCSPHIGHO2_01_FULL_43_17]OGE36764.1 MAG: protein-export membrane protein SecF [Candidatus Daviesbacteria bacterium RIFCSPHIGHO2_12_FULL_43_11]OGE63682.1 MAG: protein-export membrane protein SecF [Candidatus Daviesbacteria bacterium RIFCSPLOWO2_01_FULL_43_38]